MMWSYLKRFQLSRTAPRRRPFRRAPHRFEELESRLAPSVNVLTFHNDIASTGLNASESQLTPTNVTVGSFGKLFVTSLDGQVYAQPLVDTGVTITNGVNTLSGAAGVHDVVFVATENDSLYAIDASASGGAVLWLRTFLDTTNPTGDTNNTLGATAIGTVPNGDVNSSDINPKIGITGTPVIDPSTNILYVVVKTKETIGGSAYYVQRLHAIHIGDGTDAATPVLIGDTTNGNTNSTQIYVYGNGDGNVIDPYNGTGLPVVQFNALREHQRGAVNLVNNKVYVEWASHGDNGPYHGWVVVWDVSNITTSGFQMTGVLNTSPNNGLAGIWQGSGRLAFEADGSAFYFETGNGSGGAPVLNANGFPTNANYNEALVKAVADSTTTPTNQNANGWGLKVADYFIPYNVTNLDGADSDFGSGAPLLLPDSAGLPGHPHLMVASGKEGKIYLIDRDNLGHFDASNDHVLNAVPDGSGHMTPPVQLGGSLSTGAYFNGKIYWVSGYSSYAYAYAINANGTLSVTSQTAISNFGYLPGSVAVSANGTVGGIAWVMDRNANQIHAYDATTFATELWNSGQKSGGGDNLGAVVKFAVPTIANGQVYVGTTNSLVVYGLAQPPTAVPNPPVLSATALSGSSINLTWTDSTPAPNTATSYKIEQSIDNVTFNQVTTAPAGATSIGIGGLAPLTTYYFRIRGSNSLGDSSYSNTASATTTSQIALLDFSGGFAGSTSQLTYNGSAAINGSKAELTNGGLNQAGSVFSTSPVDVTGFTTQFTFQLTAGTSTADGFTFCIEGNGPTALGPSGGGLGYGPDHTGGTGGITNSMAIKFDLYNNQGEGVDSTGLYTGGAAPTNVGSIDLTGTGIDLHSGDTFQVSMSYDGTTLSVTITDQVTARSATQSYTINIPSTVATSVAYVGFTGGTGGLTATQDILTWTYSPNATTSPNAPSGLGATPASATSVSLNWTNNATNQTGFHLDRATDSGFTANLITESLPASPNTFTDTATGLAPGSTFYYRLRAYNSAGDSANSNSASVYIPLAPPKPTNQQVTNVTTSEIDMSWQDNAGHQADGYHIMRAANHGTFSQVASLPPTSRTPPSTYTWADTGLTAGTFYEYHIIAYNVSGNNDFAGVNATTITLAPSSVSAAAGNSIVTLSWTAPAGAQTYNVYRATTAGQEVAYATGLTTASYTDSAVTNGTTYYYTVTAVNANTTIVPVIPSESAQSSEVHALPVALSVAGFPSPVISGQGQNFTVTALDSAGNVVTGYLGTVHFTSTDSAAVLPADYTFVGADAGVHTFTATLETAGTQSLTATDTVGATITALEGGILVKPANFLVSGFPSSTTAGVAQTFTVTAKNANATTATGYTGSVHFTSSDGQAVLPADYTFTSTDAGVHTFTATLKTAGTQSLTATDSAVTSVTGTQSSITVNAAAASALLVAGFPSPTTAGASQSFTVTAQDPYGNTAPSYRGSIKFTSSDSQAALPSPYTFSSGDKGVHSFSAALKAAGLQSLTATDRNTSTITGTQAGISVTPAAAKTFGVAGFTSPTTAGDAHNFTVTAKDAFGNVSTGYTGTAHFSSSDLKAVLPGDYTFVAGDAGVHTFSATLKLAGSQSLIARDTVTTTIAGSQSGIKVNAAAASQLRVSSASSVTAGSAFDVTVTAQDPYGNIATSYTGTVHFTSSDTRATLPADYTFTSTDAGKHTFSSGATLKTAGRQTITAADTVNTSLTGTATLAVMAAAASTLSVSAPATVKAGVAFTLNVTALDPYGNRATGYRGTIHFTSSDSQAVLPADYTFTASDNGGHTFTNGATLKTVGTQTITASDTVTGTITGQASIKVNAAAASVLVVSGFPNPIAPGTAATFTITAQDPYGNLATAYLGTVHFTSSDTAASLPVNYTFTATDAGVHTFTATLNTSGPQWLTATDSHKLSITVELWVGL